MQSTNDQSSGYNRKNNIVGEEYFELSNMQMKKKNEGYLQEQEEMLDQCLERADVGKDQARQVGEILVEQNEFLDRMDKKTDQNLRDLKRMSDKLNSLLEKPSMKCVYLIIFVEFLLFIVMFIIQ